MHLKNEQHIPNVMRACSLCGVVLGSEIKWSLLRCRFAALQGQFSLLMSS